MRSPVINVSAVPPIGRRWVILSIVALAGAFLPAVPPHGGASAADKCPDNTSRIMGAVRYKPVDNAITGVKADIRVVERSACGENTTSDGYVNDGFQGSWVMVQDSVCCNQYIQAGYAKIHDLQFGETYNHCCDPYPYAEWNNDPDNDNVLDGQSRRVLLDTRLTQYATYNFSVIRVVRDTCSGTVLEGGGDPELGYPDVEGYVDTDVPCGTKVTWEMRYGNSSIGYPLIMSADASVVNNVSKDYAEYASETHSGNTYFPGEDAAGKYGIYRNLRWKTSSSWVQPAIECINRGTLNNGNYHNNCEANRLFDGVYVDDDSYFDVWDSR
jgi:hypothetical protein